MLKNFKLRTKLLGGFLFVSLIAGIIGFVGYHGISNIIETQNTMYKVYLPKVADIGMLKFNQTEIKAQELGLINRQFEVKERIHFAEKSQKLLNHIAEIQKSLDSLAMNTEELKIWNTYKGYYDEWVENHNYLIDITGEMTSLLKQGVPPNDARLIELDNQINEYYYHIVRASYKNCSDATEKLNEFQLAESKVKGEMSSKSAANDSYLLFLFILFGVIFAVIISILLVNNVQKQLGADPREVQEIAARVASGDLDLHLNIKKGDRSSLLFAMSKMVDVIKGMTADVAALAKAGVEGKLDTRADIQLYKGEFQNLVKGVNDTLDAVIGPLNVAAEYVDRISKGDIPSEITDTYYGDFNEIKNNLNGVIGVMNGLLNETNDLISAAKSGQLDKRADSTKFAGDWGELVGGINQLIDAMVSPLNVTAEYVDRISKGDIPPKITDDYQGDFNEIKNNLNGVIDVMNGLLTETNEFIEAAKMGELDKRADNTKFAGDWGELVAGINQLVDSMVDPLKVTAEYVDRISKGDIPAKISDTYHGEFNEIKNNLNLCIDSITQLVTDSKQLSVEAMKSNLRFRADESIHNGDFKEVIKGVNHTLDQITMLLDNIPVPIMAIDNDYDIVFMNKFGALLDNKTGKQLENTKCYNHFKTKDCNTENCACGKAMRTNNLATSETNAKPGNLDLEIKYTGFPFKDESGNILGAFEIVIDQTEIKNTLNEINFIADYQKKETEIIVSNLQKLSEGNLNVDFQLSDPDDITLSAYQRLNEIVKSIEVFKNSVINLKQDIINISDAALEGNLSVRADIDRHKGEFGVIIGVLNKILNLIIEPLNDAGGVLSKIASGDFTVSMKKTYKGDLERLKIDINSLRKSISDLLKNVDETVHTTASSAAEISATADSLAASTEEQSAQSDEVASAVEEMAKTVTDNALSANKTADFANENMKVATEGGKVVEETVKKMQDIATVVKESAENIQKLGESGKQIGEIISVIDDIADQTNLLALNAAIEAARAGEQGRGFAVVADEVRKLAERTTDATKQIANMIKGIQSDTNSAVKAMNKGTIEVESGIELADKAGRSLNQILGSTQEVVDMIAQIAAASEEQSATSEEISKNVYSISKVTAESAKRVQDVSVTAEELTKLTETLSQLMQSFKIYDNLDNDDFNIQNNRKFLND